MMIMQAKISVLSSIPGPFAGTSCYFGSGAIGETALGSQPWSGARRSSGLSSETHLTVKHLSGQSRGELRSITAVPTSLS